MIVVAPPAIPPGGRMSRSRRARPARKSWCRRARPAEMRDSIELGIDVLAQGSPLRSVLLTPGDTPGITADIVAQVLEICPCPMADASSFRSARGARGHPIVLPWSLAVAVPTLPDGVGVNTLVQRYRDRLSSSPVMSLESPPTSTPRTTCGDGSPWRRRRSPGRGGPRPAEAGPTRAVEKIVVRVRLFALARERAGMSRDRSRAAAWRSVDLLHALAERLPALATLFPMCLIAVNEEYAGDDASCTAQRLP